MLQRPHLQRPHLQRPHLQRPHLNGQTAVDSHRQIIVAAELTACGSDHAALPGMLAAAWIKQVLGFRLFSFRGIDKLRAEFKPVCAALNLRRMAAMMA